MKLEQEKVFKPIILVLENEMTPKCESCGYQDSIRNEFNTKVCASCCAFSAWKQASRVDAGQKEIELRPERSNPDANVEAIRTKLLERSMVGLRKYDVTTERDDLNLAQWLAHLQEELLDGAVCIEAASKQLRVES